MSIINDEMTAKKNEKCNNTITKTEHAVKIRKILVLAGDRND